VCTCMNPQCSQLAPSPELLLAAGGAIGQPWTRYWPLSQSTLGRLATHTVNRGEHPTQCSKVGSSLALLDLSEEPQERTARSPQLLAILLPLQHW